MRVLLPITLSRLLNRSCIFQPFFVLIHEGGDDVQSRSCGTPGVIEYAHYDLGMNNNDVIRVTLFPSRELDMTHVQVQPRSLHVARVRPMCFAWMPQHSP